MRCVLVLLGERRLQKTLVGKAALLTRPSEWLTKWRRSFFQRRMICVGVLRGRRKVLILVIVPSEKRKRRWLNALLMSLMSTLMLGTARQRKGRTWIRKEMKNKNRRIG